VASEECLLLPKLLKIQAYFMGALYKHIIFDLDGTLSDPREGVYNAYYYAAAKLNLKMPDVDILATLIGPPLQKGFADVFGLHGKAIDEAVDAFREYYGERGLFENKLYAGISELLEELSLCGTPVYVATSKFEAYAKRVLENFAILQYFTDVAGADYNGYHATKTGLVSGLLLRNGIRDPLEVVVVGDTHYDIEAAAELELDSVGVSYGFSSYEEIERLNPDYIAQSVSELRGFLIE
jgi:phosphoglycolate phosphatase